MEEKKKKSSKIRITIVLILMIVVLGMISYGAFFVTKKQTRDNSILAGCFDTSFTDNNVINLSGGEAYPKSDEEGLETSPYHFELTNTCSVSSKYYVILSTKTNSFSDDYIKYSIDGETGIQLGTATENTLFAKGEGYSNSYIIDTGTLVQNESITYDVWLWLKESVTYEDVQGKTWEGEIKVVSVVNTDEPQILKILRANDTNNTISSKPVAELYRYQGTNTEVTNNYICFETNDKNICTANTKRFMYRIIGVTEDNRLKLIKKEALDTAYQWHSDATTNTTWPNSDLYNGLNGDYYLNNISEAWKDKIATGSWKYGDVITDNLSAAGVASTELGFANIVNAKIGLIYIHDYFYAGKSEGHNCSWNNEDYTECANYWIHLSQNDSASPNPNEYVITRYDLDNSDSLYKSTRIIETGATGWDNRGVTAVNSIRPTIYLNSTEKIASGTGTSSDPYILKITNLVPSAPTITANDGLTSGSWHTSDTTLTFSGSGSENIIYYYGTNRNSITNTGTSVTLSTQTAGTTYYVKACYTDNPSKCSGISSYIFRLDTINPTISTITAKAFLGTKNTTTQRYDGGNTITATLSDNLGLSGYNINTTNACSGSAPTSWTSISGTNYNLSTTSSLSGTVYLWTKDSAGRTACTSKTLYQIYADYGTWNAGICTYNDSSLTNNNGIVLASINGTCSSTGEDRVFLSLHVQPTTSTEYTISQISGPSPWIVYYSTNDIDSWHGISNTGTYRTYCDNGYLDVVLAPPNSGVVSINISKIVADSTTIYNGGFVNY